MCRIVSTGRWIAESTIPIRGAMIENGKVLMIMEPLCDVIVVIPFRGPAVGMVDTTTSDRSFLKC